MGVAAVVAATTIASAQQSQPQPQPQWQSQPPPVSPQPQQQAPWYRFTLNDGRVIDVQIVGGDATSYHVMTGGALYSIPRANVMSSVALQPAVMYPPPAAPPPPPPAVPAEPRRGVSMRTAGFIYFGSFYLLTAMIASARRDNDSTASAGFVPVIGPILWTATNDEDDFGEDGWDWLAVADSAIQAAGVWWILTGGRDSSSKNVTLRPVTRRNFHGFAVGGTF